MDKQKEMITELTLDQMDKITGGVNGRYMNDENDGPFAYSDGMPHSKKKHSLLDINQNWQGRVTERKEKP